MEDDNMDWACSMHERDEKCIKYFGLIGKPDVDRPL
jgi:hypothetical protein